MGKKLIFVDIKKVQSKIENLENTVMPAIEPILEYWKQQTNLDLKSNILLESLFDANVLLTAFDEHINKELNEHEKTTAKSIFAGIKEVVLNKAETTKQEFRKLISSVTSKVDENNLSYLKVKGNKIVIDLDKIKDSLSIFIETTEQEAAWDVIKKFSDSANELWELLVNIGAKDKLAIQAKQILNLLNCNEDTFEPNFLAFDRFIKPKCNELTTESN